MQPIRRWAAVSLALMPAPVAASDPGLIISIDNAIRPAIGNPTGPAWLGLRLVPFKVAHLVGEPRPDGDAAARSHALGDAPEPARLVSFARTSIEAPSVSLLLRDAPRFSRLPGKQTDDYEAGLRTTLADGAIALQAGASYNRFRNLQTSLIHRQRLMTANAGKAKTYGVEGLVRWTPDRRLSLFATYAYRDGKLKNGLRDGRKFRLSPDRSAVIGAVLLVPAGNGHIAFTPSLAWQSAMELGTNMDGQGAVALVNAQLGYSLTDKFEVEALAANLLNRRYARRTGKTDGTLVAGEPRVFGVRARLRFD